MADIEKVDLKKAQRDLYFPPREPVIVQVPLMRFIMLDGAGSPEDEEYAQAIQALYPIAYGLKFALKDQGLDFTVMPLEGLWWADDPAAFAAGDKDAWKWTAMIRVPDEVDQASLETVRGKAEATGGSSAVSRVRLEDFEEGTAAQVMYVGPFAEEGPAIEKLHAFIAENGLALRGRHHEIYLSDPRRTAPEKLKTVIRQPAA